MDVRRTRWTGFVQKEKRRGCIHLIVYKTIHLLARIGLTLNLLEERNPAVSNYCGISLIVGLNHLESTPEFIEIKLS